MTFFYLLPFINKTYFKKKKKSLILFNGWLFLFCKLQRQLNVRAGLQPDTLTVPTASWHQPVFRTRSLPPSTSLLSTSQSLATVPSLTLSNPGSDVKLRFTTGGRILIWDAVAHLNNEGNYNPVCTFLCV